MSIVGTLLPEQLTFFTNSRDLGDALDWADDFYAPYHIYINGKYVRSKNNDTRIYDVAELGEELIVQQPDARIVILDNLGQIAFTQEDKPPTPGQFHLVYVIQSRDCVGLWDFFQDARSDLVNEDDSSTVCLSISTGELADTVFDDEDFFVSSEPPTSTVLEDKLREYILNLQQIARLYPLLEIKLYRD